MISDKELNELAKDDWKQAKDEEYDFEMDGTYYKDGYKSGFRQAEKHIRDKASENFKQFEMQQGHHHRFEEDAYAVIDYMEKAWQAALISKQKEIDRLNDVIMKQEKERQSTERFWKEKLEDREEEPKKWNLGGINE
jgi:hypothetical protein